MPIRHAMRPYADDEPIDEFRQRVRTWLDTALASSDHAERDHLQRADLDYRRRWEDTVSQAGWWTLGWPRAHGGDAISLQHQAVFLEEYARARAPNAVNTVGRLILAPTLMHHGSTAQQQRFLPAIRSNRHIWCQGYSEPNAGSDLASLSTRAERRGDRYVLHGQKTWTSYAHIADWAFVLVRTDASATRHLGISFLLVDMQSPGITVRPIRQINDEVEFNEVFFNGVEVPAALRVGEENQGWAIAMSAANFERGTSFALHQAQLRCDFADLLALAGQVGRNGRPAIEDARVREALIDLHVDVEGVSLNAARALARSHAGLPPGPEASYTKLLWSETRQRLMDLAMDILGPHAMLGGDEPTAIAHGRWQQAFLRSRADTIYAGTSEVQRNIIGERILGLPR